MNSSWKPSCLPSAVSAAQRQRTTCQTPVAVYCVLLHNDLLTTSYAILGLLASGPMSGHRLSTIADNSIGHFWSIPRSVVYRELVRLEGLVTEEVSVTK